MANQKIKLRNSGATLTGVVISLLIVMGMFFAGYEYLIEHADSAGVTVDSKYADTYGNLSAASTELDDNVNDIKDSLDDVKEAESAYQVAWNGLKGLGNALKLPVVFVSTAIATWSASINFIDFLPGWALPLSFIGIVAFVVFLVLKILKGEPSM